MQKHKSLKDIIAQAGYLVPKEYATAIHHQKHHTKILMCKNQMEALKIIRKLQNIS